jgi:hypothetical protein
MVNSVLRAASPSQQSPYDARHSCIDLIISDHGVPAVLHHRDRRLACHSRTVRSRALIGLHLLHFRAKGLYDIRLYLFSYDSSRCVQISEINWSNLWSIARRRDRSERQLGSEDATFLLEPRSLKRETAPVVPIWDFVSLCR